MSRPLNILISGSNYWNIGDDIVREGVMALLRSELHPRDINWHFYNFIAPQNAVGSCGEIANTVDIRDLQALAASIDLVIIPGLAFGRELVTFQAKLVEVGLASKTIFIGGMNENNYAAQWGGHTAARQLLKAAKLVIGRTVKHPPTMDTDAIPYKVLPCPSILSAYPSDEKLEGPARLAFSIQLPSGTPGGIVNHVTGKDAYNAALAALKEAIKTKEVDLICHHKSEFIYWSSFFKGEPNVSIIFSSWFQDVWAAYGRCDAVISTRLHAVLLCRALGKPGIVVNDTGRHQHALEQFPGTKASLKVIDLLNFIGLLDPDHREIFRDGAGKHQQKVWEAYSDLIGPYLKEFKE